MDSNSKLSTFMLECPFAVKWEIDEEKLNTLKNIKNGYFQTKWFNAANIPGVEYCLDIYPNGNKEGKWLGSVWIYLQLKIGNEKKVKADFKFFIECADFISKETYEFENSGEHGGTRFNTSGMFYPLYKYIIGGKLILKCQGTLCVEREYQTVDEETKQSFWRKLWKRNDKDFTIVVEGKNIQTHKLILGTHSAAFDGMFNSGMKEATENKMEIIDFTYEIVKIAIELMYDRKMSTLKMEEKMDVLIFFDKYCIMDLKDLLERSLAENISLTSVVQIANFSLFSNSSNLQQRCMDFIIASFRMNQLIDDFDDLDEAFAFKALKNAFYNVTKT